MDIEQYKRERFKLLNVHGPVCPIECNGVELELWRTPDGGTYTIYPPETDEQRAATIRALRAHLQGVEARRKG